MTENLVKHIVDNGGRVQPILVPFELSKGTGQMNPSLFIDDGRLLVNLRNVQYVIVHSENEQYFQSRYGPLAYLNPENDVTLRTVNFYMEFGPDLKPTRINQVNTSRLDVKPLWEFIGLEDARLVKWNHRWYLCGVRRDTTTNGEGRMELSEIRFNTNEAHEVRRVRIEPPTPSYCEKNWMPILDMPFHFVKWTNPTQVVKVDLETKSSEQVFLGTKVITGARDFRGGSSVINYGKFRMAITHEVELFNNELGKKDAQYYHRFIIWDQDWNIVDISECFKFLTARIEFCCGLGIINDKMYITFGFQDNSAFIVEAPLTVMEKFIYG